MTGEEDGPSTPPYRYVEVLSLPPESTDTTGLVAEPTMRMVKQAKRRSRCPAMAYHAWTVRPTERHDERPAVAYRTGKAFWKPTLRGTRLAPPARTLTSS